MSSIRTTATVHPRVCGEQAKAPSSTTTSIGSSPRVRGTGSNPTPIIAALRFIPACAGNRGDRHSGQDPRAVHPRVCGEQVKHDEVPQYYSGSSPRVRGTVNLLRGEREPERFIPACAGNSFCRHRKPPHRPVHPRVCGEQHLGAVLLTVLFGSSPRVRGTVSTHLRIN